MAFLSVTDGCPPRVAALFKCGVDLVKRAAESKEIAYNLVGTLYLSSSGWVLLSVPNALMRGIFAAMNEPGTELPPGSNGGLPDAHVTVMRPEELELIDGADKVTERGKQFHYTLGRLYSVRPAGWSDVARVWFVEVHSPELQALRRSYGLSSLPNDGKFAFHITCAIRRKSVLGRNDTGKGS